MASRRKAICNRCGVRLSVHLNATFITCPRCGSPIDLTLSRYDYDSNMTVMIAPPTPRPYFPPGHAGMHPNRFQGQLPRPFPSPQMLTGKKRALLCGVSYYGSPKVLQSSVNNVRSMTRFLIEIMGFQKESILVLTEEEIDRDRIPTKFNIQRELRRLVAGCQSGDSLLFYYSGHAARVIDRNHDEEDGFDEALCPADYETEGKILDDWINDVIVRPLRPGVKLHAIMDTCRSGSLLDLPFVCKMNPDGFYKWKNHPTRIYKGTNGGKAVCISACDDNQNTGDTTLFTGYPTGVLTNSFIQVITNESNITYGGLLIALGSNISEIQKTIHANNPCATPEAQEPQLSSSATFDINFERFDI